MYILRYERGREYGACGGILLMFCCYIWSLFLLNFGSGFLCAGLNGLLVYWFGICAS